MPTLTITIVNHSGRHYLKDAIDAIHKQDFKDYEIIIADTESTDGSQEYIKTNYPDVTLLPVKNNGYGYACNRAAEIANGQYLMFFNEDMIIDDSFLQKLMDFHLSLPNTEKGATSTTMTAGNAEPDFDATHPGKIDLLGLPVDIETEDSVTIPGCPLLIEKKIFQEIGGFNENIFLYGEDVDISWRLKIFGYKTRVFKGTFLHHVGAASGGASTPKGLMRIITSGFIPSFCNFGNPLFVLSMFLQFAYITLTTLAYFIIKRFNFHILKAYLDFWLAIFNKLPQLIKQRKFVQSRRKLSDFNIIKTFVFIPAVVYNRFVIFTARHRRK